MGDSTRIELLEIEVGSIFQRLNARKATGPDGVSVFLLKSFSDEPPQWGAADAEIKVPSGENTALKRSPFKAWSISV